MPAVEILITGAKAYAELGYKVTLSNVAKYASCRENDFVIDSILVNDPSISDDPKTKLFKTKEEYRANFIPS